MRIYFFKNSWKGFNKRLLIPALAVFVAAGCTSPGNTINYLFNMKENGQDTLAGYRAVHLHNGYSAQTGFGWMTAPVVAFDSANVKLTDPVLHEGLWTADSMRFRANVANGEYIVRVVTGGRPTDTTSLRVAINGQWQPDTVQIPFYRIQYRTVTRKMKITDGVLDVLIQALSPRGAAIYGIECRAATPQQSIHFTTPLQEDTADAGALSRALQQRLEKDPGNTALQNQLNTTNDYKLACYYYDGGGWSAISRATGMSLFYRLYAAIDLLEPICADPDDPLYNRALYLLARTYYWLDQEDYNLYHTEKFASYFSELKQRFPTDTLVRMYSGEQFYDEPGFDTAAHGAPRWAALQRECIKRIEKEIKWWVTQRQIDNGEMGGKYGDDVEILRWWLPAIFGADDSTGKFGYRRLADGVWASDALQDGFARRIDDVEHSAELFRDTHPSMLMMQYGDPEYVERCLQSMQHFRDVWTGVTPLGHLHFRSYYLSATEVLPNSPFGIDAALNARAILPGLWAAWYNHNPQLVDLFSRYAKAWIADAARSDNGKPAGLMPSAVAFKNDRIGGESDQWWDAHLTYDYYQWDHIGHVGELFNHILGMYGITHNDAFLAPLNKYAELMSHAVQSPPDPKAAPGTLDWALNLLVDGGVDHEPRDNAMGKLFAMAKELSGSRRYDSLIALFGMPYNQYRVTGNRQMVLEGMQELLDHARYNWPLATSEAKFTDRVYMPGSDVLMGMYTGHFGAGYEYPNPVVTWQHTGSDLAIFVNSGDSHSAHISFYNFSKTKTVTANTWQLQPGTYEIITGEDKNDDGQIDGDSVKQTVELRERVNELSLTIPGNGETVVLIKQLRAGTPAPVNAADLAINTRDISITKTSAGAMQVLCRVHNIGNRDAEQVKVQLYAGGQLVAEQSLNRLAAPNDLVPRSVVVAFDVPAAVNGMYEVRLQQAAPEFTLRNNRAAAQ